MIIMVSIKLKSMNSIYHKVIQYKSYFQILIYLLFSNIQIYSFSGQEERNYIHLELFLSHKIEP
jgi:hypothetical protein